MHPLLAQLGPVPIHTYGFMIALGFLTGIYTIRSLAIRSRLDAEKVLDMSFWGLLIGFIGARLLFVLTRLPYFMSDPMAILRVWEGGLVFWGGPIAVVPFAYWYSGRQKFPRWLTLDVCMPPLVIAHAIGRLGCLAAGCCYGRPTGSSWGIRLYSDLVEKNYQGIPLHPTQLYECVALVILFVGMMYLFRRKSFDGQVGLTYFIAYPIIRSVIEIFRGDLIRGFVIDPWLSTSQFISLLVIVPAAALLAYRLREIRRQPAAAVVAGAAAPVSNLGVGGLDLPFPVLVLAVFAGSFLLGSIPFGLLIARALKIEDLRAKGSGNIGATNVSRIAGFWPAGFLTLLLDLAKGALPALFARQAAALGLPEFPEWAVWGCAFFSVLGHCFTPWLLFKGGKGVATALGAVIVLAPVCALLGASGFAFTFFATRIGSLSSLVGLLLVATAYVVLYPAGLHLVAGAAMVGIIVLRHESNIDALLENKERAF